MVLSFRAVLRWRTFFTSLGVCMPFSALSASRHTQCANCQLPCHGGNFLHSQYLLVAVLCWNCIVWAFLDASPAYAHLSDCPGQVGYAHFRPQAPAHRTL